MERDEIRLECLKLAHMRELQVTDAIERAKVYEGFVVGALNENKSTSEKGEIPKGSKPKNVGNPFK